MIQTVQAVQFHRFMGTGRTTPALCGCEDEDGQAAGDFVVKLRGGIERGTTGLACELIASRLAAYFEIATPTPKIVAIDEEFATLVGLRHAERSERMRNSIGLNFGSQLLSGVAIWPIEKAIPEAMWASALAVFAFDKLIQNPDRKFSPNPNLFSQGDDLIVFDHELAFSFLSMIFSSETPWLLDREVYLPDHVFFRRLKGKDLDTSRFISKLAALPETILTSIMAELPTEWNNSSVARIQGHLSVMVAHALQFEEEIQRRLA